IERTGKRKTLERDHGPNTLELAQGSVKSTALRWSTIAATVLPSCDIATSLIAPPAPSSSTAPSPGANARRRSVPSSTIGRRAATGPEDLNVISAAARRPDVNVTGVRRRDLRTRSGREDREGIADRVPIGSAPADEPRAASRKTRAAGGRRDERTRRRGEE